MRTTRSVAFKFTSLSTALLMSLFSIIGVQTQNANAAQPKTVTFNANGGTGTMSSQTAHTSTALTANTFTRDGYSFANWNTAANGSGRSLADTAIYDFSADITLYAQWNPILVTHTVTFNSNGGTGSMSVQTSNVSANLSLNTFSRSGYTFANWNTAANGSGIAYADGASYSFSSDLTLYAQWTALPTYVVTFNSNGGNGSMSPQTSYGATVLSINSFTRLGYSFANWNTIADGSGKTYSDGGNFPFNENVTLYAQWIPLPSHTVTFNSNGGSGSTNTQTSSFSASLTLNTFTRVGYSFANWNTAPNGSGTTYLDGATYAFGSDLTLYAQWTAIPNHTVTFNPNGGSGSMSAQTSNVAVPLFANTFTKIGSNFTQWNTAYDGTGTDYADGSMYSFNADLTLYAQWTVIPSHTVIFNPNGGSGSMSAQTSNISLALTANSLTYSGYAFTHWNSAADGSGVDYLDGAIYDFKSNLTLYAQWTALQTFKVVFNGNGGIGTMLDQVDYSPADLALNLFTNIGYTFREWNTSSDGSGKKYADGANFPFNENVTLFAQWNQIPVGDTVIPLSFQLNGGTLNIVVTIPAHAKNGSEISLEFNTYVVSTTDFPMITVNETGGIDDFDKPIAIELPNYLPGAKLVYTNGIGTFLPIPLITPGDLETLCLTPKATGYIDNGSTITIYTCHLSSFGYRQEQAEINVNTTANNLITGGSMQLNVTGGSGTMAYIYSTTTSSVCSVNSDGLVTAISAGTCLVTVSNPGSGTYIEKSSSAVTITVTATSSGGSGGGSGGGGGASGGGFASSSAAIVSQPSVTIASAELIIQLTKTTQLTVTGGAGSGVVTYETTTPTICSVTGSGLVTGLLAGECIVRAKKAASGNYLEATSPYTNITVSDSEKRAADEAATRAEAEKLALAKAEAEAAAAAKALADVAAAAAAAIAERDRLVKLFVESTKTQSAQLALLYLNNISWKKSGKLYAIRYNLSIAYAKQIVTLQVGKKVNGKLAYKTTKRLLLNSDGDATIKQSKAPIKGSYLRVVLGNKVVYTQLVK